MKVEFLVIEVIICTTMSNSSGLILFLQNMLSWYAYCGFSVPALCNTGDRRHNIDNFSWGSSDSWCALEGIGVLVSYQNVWLISLVAAFCKRIIFKRDLHTQCGGYCHGHHRVSVTALPWYVFVSRKCGQLALILNALCQRCPCHKQFHSDYE